MAYAVRIAARAEQDLQDIFHYIHAEESDTALAWYMGLTEQSRRKEMVPNAPEKSNLVEILHVRHGAMEQL